MKRTLLSIAVAATLLPAAATGASARNDSYTIELPLSGPAYRLASEAQAELRAGHRAEALRKIDEAIRLRPDAGTLRRQRAAMLAPAPAAAGTATPAPLGYDDARLAFGAYDRGDYANAAAAAERAVARSPESVDYRLLLAASYYALQDPRFLAASEGALDAMDAQAIARPRATCVLARQAAQLGWRALVRGDLVRAHAGGVFALDADEQCGDPTERRAWALLMVDAGLSGTRPGAIVDARTRIADWLANDGADPDALTWDAFDLSQRMTRVGSALPAEIRARIDAHADALGNAAEQLASTEPAKLLAVSPDAPLSAATRAAQRRLLAADLYLVAGRADRARETLQALQRALRTVGVDGAASTDEARTGEAAAEHALLESPHPHDARNPADGNDDNDVGAEGAGPFPSSRSTAALSSIQSPPGAPEPAQEDAARHARLRTAAGQRLDALGAYAHVPTPPAPRLACRNLREGLFCYTRAGDWPRDPGFEAASQGYAALRAGRSVEAVDAGQRALAASPENIGHALLLIDAQHAAGRDQAALASADAAIAQDGPVARLLAARSRLRQAAGDTAGARADADLALAAPAAEPGSLDTAERISLLAAVGRRREARATYDAARRQGALDGLSPLALAYLASQAGDAATADAGFTRARADGDLPDTALLDSGYAAQNAGRPEAAATNLRAAPDAHAAGRLPQLGPQQTFEVRRAVDTLTRRWGAIASLTYGGSAAVGGIGLPTSDGGDALQAGAEVYYRPSLRYGSRFEVYGRLYDTLYARRDSRAVSRSLQASAGVRVRPLPIDAVFALERIVPLGSGVRGDWLVRAAYSTGFGTDLRVDRDRWWTGQLYAEAGRYLAQSRNYADVEARLGQSMRVSSAWPTLVVMPHWVVAADFDSANARRLSVGTGPGIALRYAFRQDAWTAPRSLFELAVQYRIKINGDDRNNGVFVRATLSY